MEQTPNYTSHNHSKKKKDDNKLSRRALKRIRENEELESLRLLLNHFLMLERMLRNIRQK